jgi:hypothetical protein
VGNLNKNLEDYFNFVMFYNKADVDIYFICKFDKILENKIDQKAIIIISGY